MAYTTIDKSSLHFNTKLYAGTGSAGNAQTGINFQPDFVWLKNRDNGTGSHGLFDAVRGVSKRIKSDDTAAEGTYAGVSSFDSDGFTLGTSWNQSSTNFVSWNWKANGQGSSNTDGSINTTYTSANTTSGFSISKYVGTGANATVGHGLGVAPKIVLVKDLSASASWRMFTEMTGNESQLALDQTSAADSGNTTMWNSTSPTSTVFSIGTHGNVNTSSNNYIAYCFAEKTGFSKIGRYTGSGSTDGPFVYTGFKPAFVLIKKATGSADSWFINDNKRSLSGGFNTNSYYMRPNENAVEGTAASLAIDILSNGVKIRNTDTAYNNNNSTYIYMAFAEAPLVGSNNVPCNAR